MIAPVPRALRPGTDPAGGFALVFVIWAIGLLALLFVAYIATARYRSIEATGLVLRMHAEMASQSGVNIAIFDLLSSSPGVAGNSAEQAKNSRFPRDGLSVSCSLGDGAAVTIQVADEGGKIDLNTAKPELIELLLQGLLQGDPASKAVAGRIVAYRANASTSAASSPVAKADPKERHFRSVLELDHIAGMGDQTFRGLLPLVTVHSKSPGIDPQVAPLQLLRLLSKRAASDSRQALIREFPQSYATQSKGTTFLVSATAAMSSGARHSRSALIELIAGDGYRIHEWREGPADAAVAAPALLRAQAC